MASDDDDQELGTAGRAWKRSRRGSGAPSSSAARRRDPSALLAAFIASLPTTLRASGFSPALGLGLGLISLRRRRSPPRSSRPLPPPPPLALPPPLLLARMLALAGPTTCALEALTAVASSLCHRCLQGPPSLAGGPGEPLVAEEADLHEGIRAAFPLTFGKQESKLAPLESIHQQTKRPQAPQPPPPGGLKPAGSKGTKGGGKEGGFKIKIAAKIGSQRPDGGAGLEPIGPPHSAAPTPGAQPSGNGRGRDDGNVSAENGNGEEDEDEQLSIGPPRGPPLGRRHVAQGVARGGAGEGEAEEEEEEGEEGKEDEEDDEDDDDEDEDEGDEYRMPMSNEIELKGHTKVRGGEMLSYDYTLRMYDFQGMDAKLRSFRQLEPSEAHQVRAISFSPTGDLFIVATGSAQAKVYNRDGFTQGEFVKGDMYIRDLRHTKGHISGLTSASWHPKERHTALTASEDGSVRVWDVTNFKTQKQVVKPKLAKPGRTSVTACEWGPDGKFVAAGLVDGSLQVWGVKAGWGSRPDLYVQQGHEGGEDVTGVLFSADGFSLASRSTDATVKMWDLRKFKEPLKVFGDLPNSYAQTNLAWSPDERLLLTGTSHEKGGAGGQVAVIDKDRLELVRRIGMADEQSVVRVLWHPRLNQIFATAGNKKEGGTHVLYDPALSERGALACVARAPRRRRAEDFALGAAPPVIHNPHALPLFRSEPSRKRQREKDRKNPVASKRPDLPMSGPGFGGRVGQSKGSLLTQYLLREGGLIKQTWMDEDPREAILRHAAGAAADPRIMGPAYADTAPEPIYHESDEEEEDK
eukprot:jgi/Mesen1/8640/ME000500S08114